MTDLQIELDYFNKNKEELLKKYPGQFVLIKNETMKGSFTTQEEAYNVGIEQMGNVPFLIKQVVENEPITSHPALTVGIMYASI